MFIQLSRHPITVCVRLCTRLMSVQVRLLCSRPAATAMWSTCARWWKTLFTTPPIVRGVVSKKSAQQTNSKCWAPSGKLFIFVHHIWRVRQCILWLWQYIHKWGAIHTQKYSSFFLQCKHHTTGVTVHADRWLCILLATSVQTQKYAYKQPV